MKSNIYDNVSGKLNKELFESIIENDNFKLEKIVSDNHSTEEDYWYDQSKNEFVILLKGSAELMFDNGEKIVLLPGDYLIIPAHRKHRVEKTSSSEKTFWLALHY